MAKIAKTYRIEESIIEKLEFIANKENRNLTNTIEKLIKDKYKTIKRREKKK